MIKDEEEKLAIWVVYTLVNCCCVLDLVVTSSVVFFADVFPGGFQMEINYYSPL